MGLLFLIDEKEKERDPPSAVGGLKGIEKRVGGKKKRKKKESKRSGARTGGFTSAAR